MLHRDSQRQTARRKSPLRRPVWLPGIVAGLAALSWASCSPPTPDAAEAAVDDERVVPVSTEAARLGTVRSSVGITGTLSALREVLVSAEGAGRVVALDTVLGQQVETGQVLARLEDIVERAQVDQAQAQLRQAEASLGLAQTDFARADRLRTEGAVSELQHQQARVQEESAAARRDAAVAGLKLARQSLRNTLVRAPFAGTVGSVKLELGALVAPGTPAFQLVAIDRIKVEGGVPASEIGLLEPGQLVRGTVPTLSGARFEGALAHIGPSPDPITRTYPVEVHVDNEDRRLRPGMLARLEVVVGQRDDAVLVPESALVEGDPVVVFVVEGGVAHKRTVRLGQVEAGRAEILEGVAAGDLVVTLGRQHLFDGSRVQPYDLPAADPR